MLFMRDMRFSLGDVIRRAKSSPLLVAGLKDIHDLRPELRPRIRLVGWLSLQVRFGFGSVGRDPHHSPHPDLKPRQSG